ncbi:MAG: deoxyguanosinetriphosphate triphosphohydrolase [Chloroflexi bacterium]|nr:deoxyguanosinetriphosphate triphosphohydrolase [Chloroflexota bacterium]
MINQLNIRERTEKREAALSPYAVQSKLSRGRVKPEEPCPIRTAFQRDRDRIIHCKAFRRLKHKTQVFIAPSGDHYVTRLTHTLEVAQIARTIARALNLNEDLTEAIALGHDLGHTPFGHIGEQVLSEITPRGFRHSEQSLRVVDILEKDGQGLNLTWEVRNGIVNHSKTKEDILEQDWKGVRTLEGEICKLSDMVAYINHDIDDAIRAGILTETDLPARATTVLGHSRSERINTMVCDIIERSWSVSGYAGISAEHPRVEMGVEALDATYILREFLFQNVYDVQSTQRPAEEARRVVRFLYEYFQKHENKLPMEYASTGTPAEQKVIDYIAGMTDQYALRLVEELQKG